MTEPKRRGNPAMQKGAPSVNPSGLEKAAKAAPGSTGVIAYSGYVNTSERVFSLIGRQKWVTYANAPIRSAPVAISMLLRHALLGGVKWSLVENPAGGKAAKKGLDVVQRGLLDARLPIPWRAVVPKAAMSYYNGFSLHATAMARRPDGLVTYTDIAHRPPHTAYQWLRKSPTDPFTDVVQRIDDGNTYTIALSDCFYLRNSTLSDGPEGQGVLRMIVERLQETRNYRNLEGSEFFSSMAGTPIARAPLEEIAAAAATGKTEAEQQAYIDTATQAIEDAVKHRIKEPSKQQYLKLDSATYKGSNPNTISTVNKWGIEILKTDAQGLAEIRKVITDNDLDDARILGVEFVFVGGGDTRGTFGMHESKVSLFSAQLAGDLDTIGDQGTQQLCRPLVAANGLDPDDACPTLIASPISTEDVEKTARSLGLLNMAGLTPNHPAKKAMFDRMNLPWEDEPDPGLPRVIPPALALQEERRTPVAEPGEPKPGEVAPRAEPPKPDVKP